MADKAAKKKKTKPAPSTKAVESKPETKTENKPEAKPEKKPKKITSLHRHKKLLKKLETKEKIKNKIQHEIRIAQKEQNKVLTKKDRSKALPADELKAIRQRVRFEVCPKRRKDAERGKKWEEKIKALKEKRPPCPIKAVGYHYPNRKKKLELRKKKREEKMAKMTPEELNAFRARPKRKPKLKDSLKKCGRLYCYAIFTGYMRGLRNQHENTALLKVEGAKDKKDAWWYVGKKVAFVYKTKNRNKVPGRPIKKKLRVIWGKVTRPHGHIGMVRAKFQTNLPPTAMTKKMRIMLYPSSI